MSENGTNTMSWGAMITQGSSLVMAATIGRFGSPLGRNAGKAGILRRISIARDLDG